MKDNHLGLVRSVIKFVIAWLIAVYLVQVMVESKECGEVDPRRAADPRPPSPVVVLADVPYIQSQRLGHAASVEREVAGSKSQRSNPIGLTDCSCGHLKLICPRVLDNCRHSCEHEEQPRPKATHQAILHHPRHGSRNPQFSLSRPGPAVFRTCTGANALNGARAG